MASRYGRSEVMALYASAAAMIRATSGIRRLQAIRVSLPIPPLVVVAHDLGDFGVVLDLRENPLADLGVLLHFAAFVQCQGPRLFEEARGEADLADVVYQPAHMSELLILFGQGEPLGDVPRIDRDRGRMTGVYRSLASSVATRAVANERFALERKVRTLKTNVDLGQIVGKPPLLLVQAEHLCAANAGARKSGSVSGGDLLVRAHKQSNDRRVKEHGGEGDRRQGTHGGRCSFPRIDIVIP